MSFLAINEDLLSTLKSTPKLFEDLSSTIRNQENGIVINSFKVEQKILQMTSNTNTNYGGFVNGSSKIKNLKTRYLLVLYSDKFTTITDPLGKTIKKRYGYGFGFTLNVSDIETKVGVNFGLLAASASLNLATIGYDINVYGVVDANLARYMPEVTGDFTSTVYEKLQEFIVEAKKTLKNVTIDTLYPIEILSQVMTNLENSDTKSIYFGVLKVSQGVKLNDSITYARSKNLNINENVIQFIYNYFEIKNAYIEPNSSQKADAKKWIEGKYSKKEAEDINGSWVSIDPAIENGMFVALSHLTNANDYQPHSMPSNWNTIGKQLDDKFSEISLDFSSTLKLSSIVDSSAKFNTQCITRDIAMFVDVSSNPPSGTKVIETRYGVGIRLILRISNIEFGAKINYNTIGAISELNQANVEYEISGIGISDTSLFELLPMPQDINQKSISNLNIAFKNIKDILAGMDVSKFNPQPYKIRVNEPEKIDPTLNAQATVFAIREIAKRSSLNDAIKAGLQIGIDKAIITETYTNVFRIKDTPSRDDRNKAQSWLDL